MLIPKVEGFQILGTIFSSSLFPNRAPAGHFTLTSYVGGERQPELALLPADELVELTCEDLRVLLGVQRPAGFPAHGALPQGDSAIQSRLRPLPRIDERHRKSSRRSFSRRPLSRGRFVGRFDCVRLQRRGARGKIPDCQMNKGVLLVNLGSPDSTAVGDVRRYLNEFLMDARVIDSPWLLRRFIVGMILINRPEAIRRGLSQNLDAGRFAAHCHEPPTSRRSCRNASPCRSHWRCDTRNPPSGCDARAGGAENRRGFVDSAVSALRHVELRNGGRTGEGSRGQTRAADADQSPAAVRRFAGLHRGARGQRGELSGGGLRPFVVQLSWRAGAAYQKIRPDAPPLSGGPELLRRRPARRTRRVTARSVSKPSPRL